MKTIKTLDGDKTPIPPEIVEIEPLLRRCAAIQREEKRLNKTMGQTLGSVLRRLEKEKDAKRLSEIGSFLGSIGCFSGHYFFEASHRVNSQFSYSNKK